MTYQSREYRLADKIVDEVGRNTFDVNFLVLALVDSHSLSAPEVLQMAELLILNMANKADTLELWRLPVELGETYARAQALRDLLTRTD